MTFLQLPLYELPLQEQANTSSIRLQSIAALYFAPAAIHVRPLSLALQEQVNPVNIML